MNEYTRPQQNMLAKVSVDSSESGSSMLECGTVPPSDPCAVVILGATGDLTARKLIPSLFHMYQNDRLPEAFTIVGCGRTQLNDEQFRNKLAAGRESANLNDRSGWTKFSKLIYYQPVDSDDPEEIQAIIEKGLPDPIGQLYRFSLASSPLRRSKRTAGGNGSAVSPKTS